jgi:hypothetical protein
MKKFQETRNVSGMGVTMNDNPIPKVGAWTTTGDSPPGVGASGEERGGMVKFGCPYRCPSVRFWCRYCGLSEAGKVHHKE